MGNCKSHEDFSEVHRDGQTTHANQTNTINAKVSMDMKLEVGVCYELDESKCMPRQYYQGTYLIGKLRDVYDGDTFHFCYVDPYSGQHTLYDKVRMYGYDSHELKPKKANFDSEYKRQLHILKAQEAKKHLELILKDRVVIVRIQSSDVIDEKKISQEKYGRLIGVVHVVNQVKDRPINLQNLPFYLSLMSEPVHVHMINNGYGLAYTGGTKMEHD